MKREETLCWKCCKTCGGCSWTKSFIPVKGWKAKPTKVNQVTGVDDSYMVIDCPEFEPIKFTKKSLTLRDIDVLIRYKKYKDHLNEDEQFIAEAMLYRNNGYKKIARKFDCGERTAGRKWLSVKLKLKRIEKIIEFYKEEP